MLQDFDVLTLCDTGAQWYTDVTEREHLELERRLREPLASLRDALSLNVPNAFVPKPQVCAEIQESRFVGRVARLKCGTRPSEEQSS